MADVQLIDGEEDSATAAPVVAPLRLPPVAQIVSRVTTWSDGTVHIERPGEPTQVVVPLRGV